MTGLGILLSAITTGNPAPMAADVLYSPVREIKDQSISVAGWGSGTISETDETAFEGTRSIRISTRNFFQGGKLTYSTPIDLAAQASNRNNLLRIVYKPADGATVMGGMPGGMGVPGGRGGGTPFGAGSAPGGGGGMGMPGGMGLPGGGGAKGGLGGPGGQSRNDENVLKMIRVIVTTTDDKKSEAYLPVNSSVATGERGWKQVSVPLQAIAGFDRTNKIIRSISFSADVTTTFYVGELRVVDDATPIRGDFNPRQFNRQLGAEVIFGASGQGGSSVLKYTWDFDESDGSDSNVDAEGQYVKRKFRKAGVYTITLTIQDYFGLKAPYKVKGKATINP
ncbi:MAG: PKD domain-containing protein [Fimbriimonadaceae bacterium]|nr:PKD domain-containing protein [Fimbriimonadaceae bacterium]